MASLQGAKAWVGEKFARLHAYIKSVPPDVWLGLAIGAGVLILAWLAYKHSQGSSTGQDGTVTTSTDTPIIPDTSTSGTNNIIPSLFGPGDDDNSGHIASIFQPKLQQTSSPVAWLLTPRAKQQGLDLRSASQEKAAKAKAVAAAQHQGAIVHSADILSASQEVAAKAKAILSSQHQGAIVHSADIHSASQIITHPLAVPKPPTGRRQDIVF